MFSTTKRSEPSTIVSPSHSRRSGGGGRTLARDTVLVRHYHTGLLAHSLTRYAWQACWREYRPPADEQVICPLAMYVHNPQIDFWPMIVPRALRAFREAGCAELLRDGAACV